MLARDGLPFVDFLYLQTPLQPLLSAPLIALWPGHGLLVLRLSGALLALSVIAACRSAALAAGASETAARRAVLLLAACHAFLFGASLFRNDILPAALLSLALWAGVRSLNQARHPMALWLLCGLCMGIATSVKISYALQGASAGLFLLANLRAGDGRGMRAFAGYALGGAIGLAPIALFWSMAPQAFVYGVFSYASTAPFEWYRINGHVFRLSFIGKARDSLLVMMLGPILPALVHWAGKARLVKPRPDASRFLDWMIVSGFVAAILPTPTWQQYFVPLLPPLFIRLAGLPAPTSRLGRGIFLGTALAGLTVQAGYILAGLANRGLPMVRVREEASWIGQVVRNARACGPIATLSPHLILDSGLPLDPRFATGPFFFRTGDMLSSAEITALRGISPATLRAELDRRPPAAIVVGYEQGSAIDRGALDDWLVGYAVSRDFKSWNSPVGDATVMIGGVTNRCLPP